MAQYRDSIILVIPFNQVRRLVALAIERVINRPLDAARRPECVPVADHGLRPRFHSLASVIRLVASALNLSIR